MDIHKFIYGERVKNWRVERTLHLLEISGAGIAS